MRRAACALTAVVAIACGCAGEDDGGPERRIGEETYAFPAAPAPRSGPLAPATERALDRLLPPALVGIVDGELLEDVAASRDPRLGWIVSDLLRFYPGGVELDRLVSAFETLTGADVRDDPLYAGGAWRSVTDHLIAWDTPAPPRYRERKAQIYIALERGWKPFFEDSDADVDWRLVAWGGVRIDDRPLGDPRPCPLGCIPALDDPPLTPSAEGDWYPDDRVVFGVVVGGEAVAFPKSVMEVHEMVNVTIGGRRLGIPYCTLCGSAQAYYLDALPRGAETPVLRTSGLLARSNKVMYDLVTKSLFDTFTGRALSGPLQDAGVRLDQATVVTSTWGEWKRAHPETRIVAEDGGIGREYELDPLHGRDDGGPIFPIGDHDPRLPVHVQVVGVVGDDGQAVAFVADDARAALAAGEEVSVGGIELVSDAGGLRARAADGRELPAHQAFWFAWSQFNPETELWPRG